MKWKRSKKAQQEAKSKSHLGENRNTSFEGKEPIDDPISEPATPESDDSEMMDWFTGGQQIISPKYAICSAQICTGNVYLIWHVQMNFEST